MNKFWNVTNNGKTSQIDLFGYVGGEKDSFFNKGFNENDLLKDLRSIPSDNKINISINTFGGSVYTALSIYSLLKAHKGQIEIRVDGVSMSAGTIITSVPGAKVIMPKGSMMMIHRVSSVVWGNAGDMQKSADDLVKLEENIIDIYQAKTGKDPEAIREKMNAETYFTAEEAVEFGLADEVDESSSVTNKLDGDTFMCNGLKVEAAKLVGHLPEWLPKAVAHKSPAIKMEDPKMDLEKLKADYPDLYQAVRNEGIKQGEENERARIQAIEEIAVAGFEKMVAEAKFGQKRMTAEQLAVAILKADKERMAKMLQDRQEDSAEAANLDQPSNQGLEPNSEQKQKEDAEMKAAIAAARKTFARK